MSQSETIPCPECGAIQPRTAPYCQNCGYRMRPAETMREMLQPLQREKLAEYLDREQPSQELSSRRPARQMIRPGDTEVMPSLQPDSGQAKAPKKATKAPRQTKAANNSPGTLVEGVRAVEPKTVAMMAVDELLDPAEAEQSAELPFIPAPSTRANSAAPKSNTLKALLTTGAICLVVMGFLTWLHSQAQAQRSLDNKALPIEAPRPIEIPEGPFRQGLSDESQSFIMQLCQRIHDGPISDCERDNLLTGEFPQKTVRMPAYRIDSGAVRNQDYQACVDAGACSEIDWDSCALWTPRGLQIGVRMPRALQRHERPAVCVDRDQAQSYCRWRGGDLPTHNQWEKAARGREGSLFPWGDFWDVSLANYGERDMMGISVAGKLDGYAWTSPPGAFPEGRSPYGLDDMAGNVAEWIRGDDEMDGHVRGGSWISAPFELRSTARESRDVTAIRTDTGFRCVY